MTTIIAGTNRQDSITEKVAGIYLQIIEELGQPAQLLSLKNRNLWTRNEEMIKLEEEFLIPANKFVIVMPEYNASFPGVLKMLLDNSDIKKCWWHKKAALTGVSVGRAGNLRGVEHMTAILNYLKVNVHYNKMLLSKVKEELTTDGNTLRSEAIMLMKTQMQDFMKF